MNLTSGLECSYKISKICPNQLRRACDGGCERLPDPQRPLRPLPERHQREDVPGTEIPTISVFEIPDLIAKMIKVKIPDPIVRKSKLDHIQSPPSPWIPMFGERFAHNRMFMFSNLFFALQWQGSFQPPQVT